ncbi:MAG: site-2 protease family protein [Clostridiales bacterium]|nr:site-2 protease family protein [Clostridiales bacterium]
MKHETGRGDGRGAAALLEKLRRKNKRPRRKKSRTGGMRLHISLTLYLLALVMFFLGYFQAFLSYLVAIVLHEMAHAEVARRLGYTLSYFKLTPYGAALIGEFEGALSRDEIRIAAAGPLFNLLLSVLFVAILWLIPDSYFFTREFILSNVYIAAFNLLPIFPLDGGRILLSALTLKMPRNRAYRRLRIVGFVFGALLSGLFIASFFFGLNPSLIVMAVFILVSTAVPDRSSKYQQLYRLAYRTQKVKRGLVVKTVMIDGKTPAGRLFRYINANYFTRFVLVDDRLNRLGAVDETALEALSPADFSRAAQEAFAPLFSRDPGRF